MQTKLPKTDPAWRTTPEVWVASIPCRKPLMHRVEVVANPRCATGTHARTACGKYLLSATLFAGPVDDIDECDACLMGDLDIHVVYTISNSDGRAVYVGYSGNLPQRLGQHSQTSPWWAAGLHVTYEEFPTERDALRAEVETIEHLSPLRNIRPRAGGVRRGRKPRNADKLRLRHDVVAAGLEAKSGVAAQTLTVADCAALLRISTATYRRIHADPDYRFSASTLVAILRALPDYDIFDLFETEFSLPDQP